MKVLFVNNNISMKGNGVCTSALMTAKYLREAGVEVRFLAGLHKVPDGTTPDYPLKPLYFPVFEALIERNGFRFAHCQKKVIRQAVDWADIIHIMEPFWLQRAVIDYAEKVGKPVVGTFHLYTQNVMVEISNKFWGWPNSLYMKLWKKKYFDHCSHISCPTDKVRKLLESYSFKAKLHTISNGIVVPETPASANTPQTDPYLILSIGRYSWVKGQDTILEAMRHCRHSRQIQLFFAGKGSLLDTLKKKSQALVDEGVLGYMPEFQFIGHHEIAQVSQKAYLYIHAAKLEVEGLGCIEAVREGAVPVIGEGDLVGTTEFAIDERSIFPCGDPKALGEKIDWWIEHPQERAEMSARYAAFARTFDVHDSIRKLIQMYNEALADNAA